MIITIDGPSGTGKTSVAQAVAKKLGMTYFDTGAMYRAFSWVLLHHQIPLSDVPKIEEELKNFSFDIRTQDDVKHYYVGDHDITQEIRSQKINEIVSEVSAMKIVRESLWALQRSYGEKQCAVFEGRDMGSVVFPDAEVKIYLDAKPKIRAKRRLLEMQAKSPKEAARFDEKEMEKELIRRDTYDSGRKIAPLKCPKGAYTIDTSKLEIDQVVDKIVSRYQKKSKRLLPSWLKSKKMRFIYRLVLFLTWVILKVFYRLKIYGSEHCIKRAAIIAPNHTSYLDPPLVATSWFQEVHFLAREGLFKPFLFGPFIRALNAHPIHGSTADVSVFKTIIHLLKEGKQVVLFPEGTRTEGEIQEIKPGIGMLAMRSNAAIVPTYIHGAYDIWSRHRKFPKCFGKVICVFGTPIFSESFSHLDKKLAQEEIAKCLYQSLCNLKHWYESGAEGVPP